MIAAVASDLGIGKDGKLLFHIKEDMAWFRSHTLHNVVVMGRKTLESFPGGRPLPERTHIVLSHKKHENTENVIPVKIQRHPAVVVKQHFHGGRVGFSGALHGVDLLSRNRLFQCGKCEAREGNGQSESQQDGIPEHAMVY